MKHLYRKSPNGVHHEWGDDWPHWDQLGKSMDNVTGAVARLSGCSVVCKEKYGTARWEWVLPPHRFNYLSYGGSFREYLYRLWVSYGKFILMVYIEREAMRHPEIAAELLDDLDW